MAEKKVRKIEATAPLRTAQAFAPVKKRRVAAYARVSTDKDEQQKAYLSLQDKSITKAKIKESIRFIFPSIKHKSIKCFLHNQSYIYTPEQFNLTDIINLAENLDCFEFYPDIESEDDLGRYYAEDLAIPAELKDYVDYEAYGRDVSINENGHFAPGGYIVQTGDLNAVYDDLLRVADGAAGEDLE